MRTGESWSAGLLLVALAAPPAAADEALRADGTRVSGTLALDRAGAPRFTPSAGAPLAWSEVRLVRLGGPALPPFRVAGGHRVTLRGGEQLTALFRGLEKGGLVLRPAWAE